MTDYKTRSEAAETALKRLGYGTEVIDVVTDNGTRFTSYVGDPSWDTAENRARVRSELASLRQRVADARRTLTCPHRSDATRVSDALKILRGEKP
jgi:hypothetical protein